MKKKLVFSPQAAAIVRQTRDFEIKNFISWLEREGIAIGSGCVLDYLMTRDQRETGKTSEAREIIIDEEEPKKEKSTDA